MPEVHPSAIVDPGATLADDVVIGPFTVVDAGVSIGAGTRVEGQAWITGPTRIGQRNRISPGVRLGFAPQSVSFDPDHPGPGLEIGDDNVFREGFTAHRAMTEAAPTRIGSHGFYMTNSHVGHDCRVGDRVVMATGAVLAGHVTVEDRVNFGGLSAIHQFVRIGAGAMIAGLAASTLDVPPRFVVTAFNIAPALNLVGMRRSGMPSSDIDQVRWVQRTLAAPGRSPRQAIEALRERADVPIVAEYITWLEASTRGWIRSAPSERRARRGRGGG